MYRSLASGQRVGHGVGGTEHTLLDGGAGMRSTQEHPATSIEILGHVEYPWKISVNKAKGHPGVTIGKVISFVSDGRLQGMGQGVYAGAGGNHLRLGQGQLRIQDGERRQGLLVPARHLAMRLVLRDKGEGLAFTAGTRGGGQGDERQHFPTSPSYAPVIRHPSTVCKDEITALGGIHGTSSAKSYDVVDHSLSGYPDAILDAGLGRVLDGLIISSYPNPLLFQAFGYPPWMADCRQARIGNQQGMLSELAGMLTDGSARACTENDLLQGLLTFGEEAVTGPGRGRGLHDWKGG